MSFSEKELLTAIEEAEYILIGIGEEWNDNISDMNYDEKTEVYWQPFFFYEYLSLHKNEARMEGYQKLYQLIQNKDHFVVSTCTNGEISKSAYPFQVVEPCGGYELLQCSMNCSGNLYEITEAFQQEIKSAVEASALNHLKQPTCPNCGKPLVFHNVHAPNYSEVGYLEKWKTYKEWLQKTINHNICILELGVGMDFPSVIRWPFEKIVYYNNKAKLFRVHASLSQISEEIKEKGYSLQENSVEFIKKLSYYC